MTDWKRSITIGFGGSSPRRATTCCEASARADRLTTGALASSDRASRAAPGRAEVGVHSRLRGDGRPEARCQPGSGNSTGDARTSARRSTPHACCGADGGTAPRQAAATSP